MFEVRGRRICCNNGSGNSMRQKQGCEIGAIWERFWTPFGPKMEFQKFGRYGRFAVMVGKWFFYRFVIDFLSFLDFDVVIIDFC